MPPDVTAQRDGEPVRGDEGADILGPRNDTRQAQERFLTVPPETDHDTMPNLKWSFADSHMRLEPGGWTRETTIRELPISTAMAGVNMVIAPAMLGMCHSRWDTTSRTPAMARCGFWKHSAATTLPTCR